MDQQSKNPKYCKECYESIKKGELIKGIEIPKIKEEKKVKKQEAMDLAKKLGGDYETQSNDGHYSVIEKATNKKVHSPREFTSDEARKRLLDAISKLPLIQEVRLVQPSEKLTFKQLSQRLNYDQTKLYWLVRNNLKVNRTGPGRTARYVFTPEDFKKIKELLSK